MKIIFLNVTYKQGSHGNMVSMLHNFMLEKNHESYVLYGRGNNTKDKNVYRISSKIEIIMHALFTRITGFHGFFSPFATYKTKWFIEKVKPDIIHIHELHAYFLNIDSILKFINKKKIKTYFTFHSEMMYTGKCGFSLDCDKFKTLCNKCPLKHEYPKSLFFDQVKSMYILRKNAFKGFDQLKVISPSNWLITKYKNSFLKDFPIIHINNGLDDSIFLNLYERKHHNKYILAVANKIDTDIRKGFNDLKILASRLKKYNIDVVVIGAIKKHKILPENMYVLERTQSREKLAAYYQNAFAFVILSQIENQPLTVIESLISGTPVIGYDVGGIKEMAQQPFLSTVPFGKILEIEKKILTLEKIDPKEIQDFALKAFSKETFLKNHERIYLNI